MRCKRGTTKKLMQTQGGVLEALDISELNCTTRFICIVLYVLYRLICISEKKKTCCITRNSHPQGRSSIDYRISCLNLPAVSCFFTVSVRQVWNHLSPEEKTCLWAMNQETTIRSRVAMHCHGCDTTADSLEGNGPARGLDLGLHLLGLLALDALPEDLWQAFDEVLRLLQTQTGDGAHLLDHSDLLFLVKC